MKKCLYALMIVFCLCITGYVLTEMSMPIAAYNPETPPQEEYEFVKGENMQPLWEIDTTGQSSASGLYVYSFEDGYMKWDYEIPKNGATVMIFFDPTCTTSQKFFLDLERQSWLDDERINVMALSSGDANETLFFSTNYTWGYEDKFKWYSGAGHVSAYYAAAEDSVLGASTYPIVAILTEEECQMEDGGYDLCRVYRFGAISFTDTDIITRTLKWMFPDMGMVSELEIPDKEYRTIDIKLTRNYDYTYDVAELVNVLRERQGTAPVALDANLTEIAMQRAAELAINYAHKRANYTDFNTIISEWGYDTERTVLFSENIAMGFTDSYAVVEGWANSPGHYGNMVALSAIRIGVGHAEVNGVHYWVQVFDNRGTVFDYGSPTPMTKTGKQTLYVPVLACTEYLNIFAESEVIIRDNNVRDVHLYQVTHFSNSTTSDMLAADTLYRIPLRPVTYDKTTTGGIADISWNEERQCFEVTPKKKGTGTFKVTFTAEQKEEMIITVKVMDPYNHNHVCSFSEWREYKPTNCYTGGIDRRYCLCGEKEYMNTPIQHKPKTVAGKAPTCTTKGYTESSYCSVCLKDLVLSEEIPEAPHDDVLYRAERPATCTEYGSTAMYECRVCKRLDTGKSIPKLPHTEVEIEGGKAPTCTKSGSSKGMKCSVCGTKTKDAYEIPALGHDETAGAGDKAPTCTEAGYTGGKTCKRCGEVTATAGTIPALGHDEEIIPGTPATCQKKGISDGKQCKRCGVVTVKQTELKKTGHKEISVPGKAATCIAAGYSKSSVCEYCGLEIVPALTLPQNPYNHTWDEGVRSGRDTLYTCIYCKTTKLDKDTYPDDGGDNPGGDNPGGDNPGGDNPGGDQGGEDKLPVFTDVKSSHWFAASVEYCVQRGYVAGMTETTFVPNGKLTRAQFLTILAKLDGVDLTKYDTASAGFTDVKTSHWYNEVVCWAVEKGITSGISATQFGPNNNVTRAQLARFFYVYCEKNSISIDGRADISVFPDAGKVAEWAQTPIAWAVNAGLISGVKKDGENYLDPNGTATRAQATVMFKAFDAFRGVENMK